jgi:NADPH-dependent ferric siderophore reductase
MPASQRPLRRATVLEIERLTPNMMRIVFGGEGMDGFEAGEFTDNYVKLQLPPPRADYGSDFDADEIRTTRPRELWPRTRTYSVQNWDPAARRLTIDFVVHGDSGVAGPWAAGAQPGDILQLRGPGGAYAPDPQADWHLLVGDASVIPAISAALARIPDDTPAFVVLEVDGPEEQQALPSAARLRLQWLHRTRPPGEEPELAVRAVQALQLPAGRGHAFVHGEASSVRAVRRHLLTDRGLPADSLSVSGYWKLRRTEEGWREDKAEWQRLAAADVANVEGAADVA